MCCPAEPTPYHSACALRKPSSDPSDSPAPNRHFFGLLLQSKNCQRPNAGGCNVRRFAQLPIRPQLASLIATCPPQLHASFAAFPQLQCVRVKSAVLDR